MSIFNTIFTFLESRSVGNLPSGEVLATSAELLIEYTIGVLRGIAEGSLSFPMSWKPLQGKDEKLKLSARILFRARTLSQSVQNNTP